MKRNCLVCGAEFVTYPSVNKRFCSRECTQANLWSDPNHRQKMSDAHKGQTPAMKGKKHKRESILKMRTAHFPGNKTTLRTNGYIYIYAPDHPKQFGGRIPEHVFVMEQHIGRILDADEVVHHKNHNKTDNRIENLELMKDSEHRKMHAIERGLGVTVTSNNERDKSTGRFVSAIPGLEAVETKNVRTRE